MNKQPVAGGYGQHTALSEAVSLYRYTYSPMSIYSTCPVPVHYAYTIGRPATVREDER